MTKKRSIFKLCLVGVLTLIGLFLTFFSFVIPTTNTTFKGFFNAVNYGYDIDGGILAVYKPLDDTLTGHELTQKVEGTVTQLNSALSNFGFMVTKQNDTIRLEISQVGYKELTNKLNLYNINVFSLLSSDKGILFSDKNTYSDASGASDLIDGKYIKDCTSATINGQTVLYVNFNEEGQTKFKNLTAGIDKLYVYVDGSDITGGGFELGSSEGISKLTLTPSNNTALQALKLQFSVMARPMLLTEVTMDTISGGLDTSTTGFFGDQSSMMIAGLFILAVATIILFCVKYRVLGAMASFSMLIFSVIYFFLLQSIPLVCMDIFGVLGALVTYGLLVAGMVNIFEKIKSEYSLGKKVPNSFSSGFRKNVIPTLEKYVYLLIFTAVMYLVGYNPLKAIAVNLFVGLFVNYFILFVVLRFLCAVCLPITAKKEHYSLKREATKNEI